MRMHLLYALHQGMVATIPVACAVVAFATHAALGRSFDLHTMLMVIGCIEQMASAMMVMPNAIMFATMISISFTRFGRVFASRRHVRSTLWHWPDANPSLSRARAFSGMWTRHDRAWPMSP